MYKELKLRILARFIWLYMQFMGRTSRLIIKNQEIETELYKKGQTFIYTAWHGRQVIFPYTHRGNNAAPLISPSKDGEIIARSYEIFGLPPVRGSSSRSPRKSLIHLLRTAREGRNLAFTPDGPLGPERKVKHGILYVAQKLQIPIMPMGCGLKRKIVFRGWDTFLFPLPFGRIVLVYGNLIWVRPDDNIETKALELEAALDKATLEADELAGGEIPYPNKVLQEKTGKHI
ncbi:lysophospholipid acyltransferase family protein [Elusimicrobiota bacterium]